MFESFIRTVEEEFINAFKRAVYYKLEYDCHTNLTDETLLKMQIDWTLENGNEKRFIELSNQLKEIAK